jgi:hypothetical protein
MHGTDGPPEQKLAAFELSIFPVAVQHASRPAADPL